jgi:hypothetical protein
MLCHLKQKEGISSLKEALMVGEKKNKKMVNNWDNGNCLGHTSAKMGTKEIFRAKVCHLLVH